MIYLPDKKFKQLNNYRYISQYLSIKKQYEIEFISDNSGFSISIYLVIFSIKSRNFVIL